jgi:SAM-dependent methyltransferase
MEKAPGSVGVVDANIEHMIRMSILHLIQLGTKHGVFKALSKEPTYRGALDGIGLPNKKLLLAFLNTLKEIGVVEEKNGRLALDSFSYKLDIPKEHYEALLPGWVAILEEIYRMVDYAFITPTHPHVLMDFDKDADFWDIRMNTDFARLYRKAIIKAAGIKKGASVLDLGCGSVSPYEFGKAVGYTGFYAGVDYSPSILDIARARVEGENLPVELRELDVRLLRPVNEYDAVVISYLLEYVKPEDYKRVLFRALETLKPGGVMIILEPFRDRFKHVEAIEFFEKLNSDFKRFPAMDEIKEHIKSGDFEVSVEELGKSMLRVCKLP